MDDAQVVVKGLKYVTLKTHNKVVKKKQEYEKLYWELWHEHEELKKKLNQ